MSEHTPGPWTMDKPLHPRPDQVSDRLIVHRPSSGPKLHVAEVFQFQDYESHAADGAALHNARLIAAAPDLLAACEAALDPDPCRFDHHGTCQAHGLGNPCEQKLIREAIAKAKGLEHDDAN